MRRLESVHVVLTPEYVEFEYPLAGVTSRLLAWLLDALLSGMITAGIVVLLGVFSIFAGGFGVALIFVAKFVIDWGYFVFFEMIMNGQTPGKRALSLRVLQDTGVRVGFYQSMLRNLVRPLDTLPLLYLVGGVAAALTHDGKRLGDFAAGTIVVREQRRRVPTDVARPEGDAAGLGRATDKTRRASVEERELFLSACLRREELSMNARLSLFPDLARFAKDRFSVEKPAHLSDEKFVVAVTHAMLEQATPLPRRLGPKPARPSASSPRHLDPAV